MDNEVGTWTYGMGLSLKRRVEVGRKMHIVNLFLDKSRFPPRSSIKYVKKSIENYSKLYVLHSVLDVY